MSDSVLVNVAKNLVVKKKDYGKYIEVVQRLKNGQIQKIYKIAVNQLPESNRGYFNNVILDVLTKSVQQTSLGSVGNMALTVLSAQKIDSSIRNMYYECKIR